jgi:hypothetical protein
MGILVPSNFPMGLLANEAERRVVQQLCDRLSDGWVVIPDVGLQSQRDHQIDIVIAHPRGGVAVVEVKGHRPSIRGGMFEANGRVMKPQPLTQAKQNAYELRDRLREVLPNRRHLRVEYAVAFPNAGELAGALPPGIANEQILTAGSLDDLGDAIDRLTALRSTINELGDDGVAAVVGFLRPDSSFSWDSETQVRHARSRLDQVCDEQVRALETLDLNQRVCVTGGAGAGKTRLAMSWARRAAARGERVLLTCFNEPLAAMLAEQMADAGITVEAFHPFAQTVPGMPHIEIPDDADSAWWDSVLIDHLERSWHSVSERFDTIVVDEAQDFDPRWLTLLEHLLDPDGPRRFMLLPNTDQAIFGRGFSVPGAADGWTRCNITVNCRNSAQIASVLRRSFAGPPASVGGPESESVHWSEAADEVAAVAEVGEAIDVILDERDHAPESILVATASSQLRDQLINDYAFSRWEDRDHTTIVCENVHRMKGLEFDHLVLVVPDAATPDELLYVGVSCAILSLTVIGPRAVAERLHLTASKPVT